MAQAWAAAPAGALLHLNEGPVDLVIRAWGDAAEIAAAYAQAAHAFDGLLQSLVDELAVLRRPVGTSPPAVAGPVARRMARAVWPYRDVYITPMAAVAGAVADHMLAAMVLGRRLERAFVNDGGDIALHLGPGARLRLGMVADVALPRLDGTIEVKGSDRVRGVATSGQGGRSFSLGIADAVTVLAGSAAEADAAATFIANAVNVDHPNIERLPARSLDPDSDLGSLLVTVAVGSLEPPAVSQALDAGAAVARRLCAQGLIEAAALRLQGRQRLVGRRFDDVRHGQAVSSRATINAISAIE